MTRDSDSDSRDFSYRDATILRKEVQSIDIYKANLADKMYRFTTRANVILSDYSVLLTRSTDRSHTHLVYRSRDKKRNKMQTLTALTHYFKDNDITVNADKITLIEIIRLDVNDEWARMEYGRLRTLAYMDASNEIGRIYPDELQEFIDSPRSRTFHSITPDPIV